MRMDCFPWPIGLARRRSDSPRKALAVHPLRRSRGRHATHGGHLGGPGARLRLQRRPEEGSAPTAAGEKRCLQEQFWEHGAEDPSAPVCAFGDAVAFVRDGKLDVDKKLIDIFKHHTIQRPTILGDSSVYQTFEEEDQRAEREFMEKDLAKVFASEKDRETASVAPVEMASIATALANMARMKDQLRSVQHRILQNSHDE
eukprot:g32741.t1